jgi:anti-sigma B factor antagonist
VRLSAGIRVVVLSALLFSIGDWWAAPLLLVAAAFTAIFCVLRIVRGYALPAPADAQRSRALGHRKVTQMHDGSFPFEVVSGLPVVTAPEEIDITNAPALRSALLKAATHGHGTVAVDMTQTSFCDSSGLHTLLAAHKCAQAEGGGLLLAVSATAVLRVLALTGIDRIIPNFTSLDEALAHPSANGLDGHLLADGVPGVRGRQER